MESSSAAEHPKFFYFVDNIKYESTSSSITGAEIKSRIPNFDPQYSLFVEGHGNEPDQLVNDNQSFSLEVPHGGPRRFYTAPPATFGRQ